MRVFKLRRRKYWSQGGTKAAGGGQSAYEAEGGELIGLFPGCAGKATNQASLRLSSPWQIHGYLLAQQSKLLWKPSSLRLIIVKYKLPGVVLLLGFR